MTGQKCDGCGAPDAIPTHWDEALCPACIQAYGLSYAASDHLSFLLKEAIKQYWQAWGPRHPAIKGFPNQVSLLAYEAAREHLEESTPH